MAVTDLSDNAYTLQPPAILALKKKIEQIGTPLKDWDINIYRGVLTGFNEAFIIDNDTKQALCKQDPKSAEIIRPILRGRDIKAYEHNWAGLWLINSHNGDKNNSAININNYPAIKNHLDQYYPQLEKRCDQGKTPYNLRDCAYLAEFAKEKIAFPVVNRKWSFPYISKGVFILAPMRFITATKSLKFIKTVFGSSTVKRYWKIAGIMQDNTGYQMDSYMVEQIPIPQISETAQQPFVKLADKILTAKQNDKDTTDLEAKIDAMVYQLYDLTAAEISLISDSLN